MNLRLLTMLGLTAAATAALAATVPPPPATPAGNTVDLVQGAKIADPYRWLENWNDPKVQAWSDAQNARTRAYLDGLPDRAPIKEQLTQLIKATSPSYAELKARGSRVFAMYFDPKFQQPMLMTVLHGAMSREMTRDRDSILSICTLPADARVADFLRNWAESLSDCGLRHDQITLRMTRAEIGNFLGMKLETVSRALSRLAREEVICFSENGRRDVHIPDLASLEAFIQRCVAPQTPATIQ
jgi:hypothetical protein